MSKKRVYVSSTYEDLVRHRAAVVKVLEAQYDVECMEKYPAFDERPKDKCLADVAASDYFILILGLRYGFEPCEDNPKGKSITHLEYDHAFNRGKPCFAFFLDDKQRRPAKSLDARANPSASTIRGLRILVEQRHGRKLFKTPDELASLVLQALSVHEHREREQSAAAFHWPRAWDFTAFMEEKRAGFHGRPWLFAEFDDWLRGGEPRALLIKADLGVGKSAFLSELVCRNLNDTVVAWHFCQHDTQETLKPATFVRSLAAHLAQRLAGYREVVEADPGLQELLDLALDDPSSAFEAVILNPLSKLAPPPSSRVLVVDAVDEGLELKQDTARKTGTILSLLSTKAARLPKWLRILATSRNNPAVITPLREAFGLREVSAEEARNQDDLHDYVLARCAGQTIADKLRQSQTPPATVATLLKERSRGRFLYAVRALKDLADGTISVAELAELPPGMDAFYLQAFQRRFDKRKYAPFKELLGVLAAAREPLPSATLAAILKRQEDRVKAQRGELADLIAVRQGGYALDHFSLAEWLTKENDEGTPRAAGWAVDLSKAHKGIRDWAIRRVKAGAAHREPYLLRHLDSLLADPERDRIFAQLLFDARWLYAKLMTVGVAALIADCQYARQSDSVRLLHMALRNSAHELAAEPRLLPGQVIGRLAGQALPELQALCQAFQQMSGEWKPALLPLGASLTLSGALVATLRGPEGVTALAVLPDDRLAVAFRHAPVRVWTPGSGSDPTILGRCRYGVASLVALPDGRLAAGTEGGDLELWERLELEPTVLGDHGRFRSIRRLVVLSDGRLASAAEDPTVRVWDLAGRIESLVLRQEGHVSALVLLPDGRLASSSTDGPIRVWDPVGGAEPVVLKGHQGPVHTLVALPDGRLLSGGQDKTIRIWDCSEGAQHHALSGHEGAVTALAAQPGGRIASGSSDGRIRVWTLPCESEPTILEGHTQAVRALASLPDDRLVSGADDGDIRVWNSAGMADLVLHAHQGPVSNLTVLSDGKLASASYDGSVRVWEPGIRDGLMISGGVKSGISALALLPDGRLVSGQSDGTVQLRDVTRGSVDAVLWRRDRGPIDTLRVMPDGRLACGTPDAIILLRDLARRSKALVLKAHENVVGALAVFPDGRLAYPAHDHTVHVWNPWQRRQHRFLRGHEKWIWALALLPDGRLASGSADRTIRVWNLDGPGEPLVLRGHDSIVFSLTVLYDGRLASGSGDCTVRVWDPAGQHAPLVLRGHESLVSALAALPGDRLASGSADRSVRLWDLRAGCEIARFHVDAKISAMVATPDGLIFAGDTAGTLHCLRLVE